MPRTKTDTLLLRLSETTRQEINTIRLANRAASDTAVIEEAISDQCARIVGGDYLNFRIAEKKKELADLMSLLPV